MLDAIWSICDVLHDGENFTIFLGLSLSLNSELDLIPHTKERNEFRGSDRNLFHKTSVNKYTVIHCFFKFACKYFETNIYAAVMSYQSFRIFKLFISHRLNLKS
jgi:uncharacterized membrane protein